MPKGKKKNKPVICPYCNKPAPWVENKAIYGRNYGKSYMAYYCKPCNAYVGCHQNSRRPLGTMANAKLREWRKKAHAVIDPLWREKGLTRDEVYNALHNHFKRPIHIGESDVKTCKEIVNVFMLQPSCLWEKCSKTELERSLNLNYERKHDESRDPKV